MAKFNKITILSITAGLISVSAMNAVADDEYGIHYNDQNTSGWLWGGSMGGSSVHNAFKALADQSVLSFEIERNITTSGFTFGTYTYGNNGLTLSEALGTVGAGGNEDSNKITLADGTTGTTAYSGAFTTGDIVGIWVKQNGTDDIYYSDYSFDTGHAGGQYTDVTLDDASGVASSYFHFNDGTWKYGWPGIDTWQQPGNPQVTDIKIRVTGASPSVIPAGGGVSGGPLPGVWATIALAGAAGTYLKRRKNK